MLRDYILGGLVLVGATTITAVVFTFPALTSGGGSGGGTAAVQAAMKTELEHCKKNQSAANCACFAQVAGQVAGHQNPQASGALYMDKTDLARSQASGSC